MDYPLHALGDGGVIRGEKPCVEAAHAAGRRDGARDQKQSGRIGQQARLAEGLPRAFERRRSAIALAPEAETGFLTGLADRGDGKRACARGADLWAPLQQIFLERLRDRGCDGNAVVVLVNTAAGKDEFAGHEHHLVVAFADQHLRDGGGAIDQDQRGGVYRAAIGVVVGFLLFLYSLAHVTPAAPLRFLLVRSPDYCSGLFSSNPCMRSAHCTPTTAPFTGCSSSNDSTSVNGR